MILWHLRHYLQFDLIRKFISVLQSTNLPKCHRRRQQHKGKKTLLSHLPIFEWEPQTKGQYDDDYDDDDWRQDDIVAAAFETMSPETEMLETISTAIFTINRYHQNAGKQRHEAAALLQSAWFCNIDWHGILLQSFPTTSYIRLGLLANHFCSPVLVEWKDAWHTVDDNSFKTSWFLNTLAVLWSSTSVSTVSYSVKNQIWTHGLNSSHNRNTVLTFFRQIPPWIKTSKVKGKTAARFWWMRFPQWT